MVLAVYMQNDMYVLYVVRYYGIYTQFVPCYDCSVEISRPRLLFHNPRPTTDPPSLPLIFRPKPCLPSLVSQKETIT